MSELQKTPLNQASAVSGSDCEQAAPLAEFSPFDGPYRSVNSGAEPDGPNRAVTTVAQTRDLPAVHHPTAAAGANGSRFIRACLRLPVDRTPLWFLRQAGRYMPEYMAVRKHHSLLDICRTPDIAAEVTITAAERLGVDAAIIFADLLLPFTPMGLDFEFVANEGPQVHSPIRTTAQARALRTDRTDDLRYVARAIEKVAAHFAPPRADGDQLGIIGFCGAPFTLASYMIEGGSSRNYIETKRLMYASTPSHPQQTRHPERSAAESKDPRISTAANEDCHPERNAAESKDLRISTAANEDCHPERSAAESKDPLSIIPTPDTRHPERAQRVEGPRESSSLHNPSDLSATNPSLHPESAAWPILMEKLITVLVDYAAQQVEAGADVIQVFDSWVGALSPTDYRQYVLAPTTELIHRIQALGVPVIYFGVDTASLLPAMRETGADVLGLDWRTPLDQAWRTLNHAVAVQGNLDPITLFAPEKVIEARVAEILAQAAGRPGHIFNLGHGIVPNTPVEAVLQVVRQIKSAN